MDNEYYNSFLDASEKAIKEKKSPATFRLNEDAMVNFVNKSSTQQRLSTSLQKGIEHLDEELNRFEKNFSNNNNTIFWASSYEDVFDGLKKLIKLNKVKSVRVPNIKASTIFREIGIKFFLRDENIALREDGDMQFFVADMLFSDTGSLLLLNQTNNNLQKITNNCTNVFFTTIDRICNNSNWIEVIQQLSSYRTGAGCQDMIVYKGLQNTNNYLFIIDNQRTSLLEKKDLRQALTCINCGRCNDVCPVYQTIGDDPYNNVFTGPMANVALPYLETFDTYGYLSFGCTLCGRCEEVCPLNLPIRDMIVDTRHYFLTNEILSKRSRRIVAAMRRALLNRSKMNTSRFLKRHLFMKTLSSDFKKNRRIPPFSKESFNKSYKNSAGKSNE